MTVLVRWFLHQSVVPCYSILPKHENESENPSPRSFTFHVFAQLSLFVAVLQGVCCSYLTSYGKYALFSFLKGREKDQTGIKLISKLPTESGVSCYIEPTSLHADLPFATFSCFRLHHPQTQQKSAILASSKVGQKMGGTISHVAVPKL